MATVATSSRLFEGYRSLGLISSEVPALIRYIDKINKLQIVTAVGRSFLVFNEKLQLIETCKFLEVRISVLQLLLMPILNLQVSLILQTSKF